jgi:membrane-bound lytic murein transglycosylase D
LTGRRPRSYYWATVNAPTQNFAGRMRRKLALVAPLIAGCMLTSAASLAFGQASPPQADRLPAHAAACSSAQTASDNALAPSAFARSACDAPIDEVRDVREVLSLTKPIDLTTPPDDLWDRIRTGFAMPNLYSPLVLDRQIWYASRPQMLNIIFERSKRYLYYIVEQLEKRGMPTEIALLPIVESAFNPLAYSRAHASGLWQFIPSTGKRYELQQNWWYDARRDIIASTTAALDYLQFLYDMHGDWHLALASYNWGENAVARAIEKNRAKGLPGDYLSLAMPVETRYYVPKLQALKNIIASPQAFGANLDPIPNQPYFVTVTRTQDIDIKLAAKLAEMSVEELIALNPAYNRPVIPAAQSQTLVLPADRAEVYLANLEDHDKPLTSWEAYTIRSGDRIDKLAAQRGIALAKLKQVNGITPKTKLGPGYQLLLPVKGTSAAAEPLPAVFMPPPEFARTTRTMTSKVIHTVQRGETLASIAQRYQVGIDDLRRWNAIGRLYAGQKLTVEREVTVSAWTRKAAPVKRKAGKATAPTRPRSVIAKAAKPTTPARPRAVLANAGGSATKLQ